MTDDHGDSHDQRMTQDDSNQRFIPGHAGHEEAAGYLVNGNGYDNTDPEISHILRMPIPLFPGNGFRRIAVKIFVSLNFFHSGIGQADDAIFFFLIGTHKKSPPKIYTLYMHI